MVDAIEASGTPPYEFRPNAKLTPMHPVIPQSLFDRLAEGGHPRHYPRLRQLRTCATSKDNAFLIISGWASSAIVKSNGELCMIAPYFPGDLVGLPNIFAPTDTEVTFSLSSTFAIEIKADTAKAVLRESAFADAFDTILMRERALLLDRLFVGCQGDAASRLAQFLVTLVDRSAIAPVRNQLTLATPLRQSDIADFVGMTSVHVNRILRGPQMYSIVQMRGGNIEIADVAQLKLLSSPRLTAPYRGFEVN